MRAPRLGEVWPKLREFCGDDVLVAHNGCEFDFRVLTRVAKCLGATFDSATFDSLPLARELFPTSRRLEDLAQVSRQPGGPAAAGRQSAGPWGGWISGG